VYQPGEDVSSDPRSENWFNSTEVGGTSSGTGLDMAQTSPDSDDIIADSMTVSGASVTFTGLDTDDDDDDDEDDNSLPQAGSGAIVEIKAPTNYLISTSSGYSVFASSLLTEIAPVAGMPVTLSFNSVDYDLFIAPIPRVRMPFRERVAVQLKFRPVRHRHLRFFDSSRRLRSPGREPPIPSLWLRLREYVGLAGSNY
jgi:hypothetical protein